MPPCRRSCVRQSWSAQTDRATRQPPRVRSPSRMRWLRKNSTTHVGPAAEVPAHHRQVETLSLAPRPEIVVRAVDAVLYRSVGHDHALVPVEVGGHIQLKRVLVEQDAQDVVPDRLVAVAAGWQRTRRTVGRRAPTRTPCRPGRGSPFPPPGLLRMLWAYRVRNAGWCSNPPSGCTVPPYSTACSSSSVSPFDRTPDQSVVQRGWTTIRRPCPLQRRSTAAARPSKGHSGLAGQGVGSAASAAASGRPLPITAGRYGFNQSAGRPCSSVSAIGSK